VLIGVRLVVSRSEERTVDEKRRIDKKQECTRLISIRSVEAIIQVDVGKPRMNDAVESCVKVEYGCCNSV